MKLSSLLSRRQALLNQARLANLAFAYQALSDFAARASRAGLRGAITLKSAAPEAERYCATLTAEEANQSVIEEHFTDDDLMMLADVVAFATGHRSEDALEVHFQVDDIAEAYLLPIRADLERAGVKLDPAASHIGEQTTG